MNTHKLSFGFILCLLIIQAHICFAQSAFPKPDHIVIVIMENHSYKTIIGSSAAPYINALANDTSSALFTHSHGVTHPSQPNYLVLYSGNTQGVKDDKVPGTHPFNTVNLGRQLIDIGESFLTYSEDLPEIGYNGESSDNYARKHNPAANWMGTGENQIPTETNLPFTAFPTSDFNVLPKVCFVLPSQLNDMHNGTDPQRITQGDNWIKSHLDAYIQWAKNHNSLFILTFDEDDNSDSNHIPTIFTGEMIHRGHYSARINHYSLLHTIEKMYGLSAIGDSIAYPPISYCWKDNAPNHNIPDLLYPNPAHEFLYIQLSGYTDPVAGIYDVTGKLVQQVSLSPGRTQLSIKDLKSGLYLLEVKSEERIFTGKFFKD